MVKKESSSNPSTSKIPAIYSSTSRYQQAQ